jgi:hypothetical protein
MRPSNDGRTVPVRRAHHAGAGAPHAVGAFWRNSLFKNAFDAWHGWCNAVASHIVSRNQE